MRKMKARQPLPGNDIVGSASNFSLGLALSLVYQIVSVLSWIGIFLHLKHHSERSDILEFEHEYPKIYCYSEYFFSASLENFSEW